MVVDLDKLKYRKLTLRAKALRVFVNPLKMKIKPDVRLSFFFMAMIISMSGYSQGCSDAGFCTVGVMKSNINTNDAQNFRSQIKTGVSFGMVQYQVSIITSYVEYSHQIGGRTQASVKLLAGFHSGELATTVGMSDAIVQVSHRIGSQITALGGIKIPFNQSALSKNGRDLPMAYQTSLGTLDIILGVNYVMNAFSLSIGYQQPVTQNKNTFLAEDYLPDSPESKYISTNGYVRKGDALLRFAYSTPLKNNNFTLITSALPIYHLDNDQFLDSSGKLTEIAGSAGLTLNLNASLLYEIAEKKTTRTINRCSCYFKRCETEWVESVRHRD